MQERPGEREGEERERGRKGERGKEEEGRKAEEERDKEIKKDVMGWTVVTRSKKQRKRVVQIFVKAGGMKTVLRKVSPEDKVQKILDTVSGSDQDVYATCEGRMLRKDDELRSCGATDGCTVQVRRRKTQGREEPGSEETSREPRETRAEERRRTKERRRSRDLSSFSLSLCLCLSVCVSLSLCVVCCCGARGCGCGGGGGRGGGGRW